MRQKLSVGLVGHFAYLAEMVKKVLLSVFVLLLALALVYYDLLSYGLRQATGQLNIIWRARPISEVLADEQFPDSLKRKLILVDAIRQFAIDSLGLKDTKNYRTVYDQQGKEIMWVVTACEPFMLVEKQWEFPVLGMVPYKGYFNKELALKEQTELEKAGWDVNIRNPGGWSTLGWFTDPILSKMLERSEGDLASLIIHEMAHATIFVKDSVDFNENLASFIGDRGAEQFLMCYFGKDSQEYQQFMREDEEFNAYANHMLRGFDYLDSLYKAIQQFPPEKKLELKNLAIGRIIRASDTLNLSTLNKPAELYKNRLPNNAYFMSFKRYRSRQNDFWEEWRNEFNSDLKNYISHFANTYPFL
ncbi:aminopeptidase [Oscillatoria amoena NRMC-F 0135]|nr:aminopeptidase [Oscillatoria amoena NRMC-F 0135]